MKSKKLFGAVFEREFGLLIILVILIALLTNKVLNARANGLGFWLLYGFVIIIVYTIVFSTAFLLYKDPAKRGRRLESYSFDELPLVSCMVAVFNEEQFITRCLDSMLAQEYAKKEVIVVNDASTDSTKDVLEAYHKLHPELIVIHLEQNSGKKAALCRAMLEARGTIFAHTDSDSQWEPQAIERIVHIFMNDPLVGAVSGHGRAFNADVNVFTKMQDAWMEGQFSIRKAFESVFGAVSCVSGPLAVFRKETIYNFLPAWEGDVFMGQKFRFATDRTLTGFALGARWRHGKLLKNYAGSPFLETLYTPKKWKVVYCRSARSYTIVPDTLKRILRQQIRWKKSFIRNIFQVGPFIWRKPLPVALNYYLHVLFVFFAPFVVIHVVFLSRQFFLTALVYYIFSVVVVGMLFALALKFEDKECRHWFYRPLMSVFSTLVLSWLIFYAIVTVRKMVWHRG